MSRYAVFGHPVSHSLSPRIHAAFARQTGIVMQYTVIDAAPGAFASELERFAAAGGRGANVTLPLKELAFALCTQCSAAATRAGSVNTLLRRDGQWFGDNTDGAGLVRDITGRWSLDLRGRRALLLGAGGSARGVAPALLDAGVSELIIANRTPERADALADSLGEPTRAHSRYWDDLINQGDFTLIINATSASREDNVEGLSLPTQITTSRTLAIDLNYGEAAIPFMAWAHAAGCRDVIDGLGMLVEQAAASFEIWHGVRPDTDEVYAALRKDSVLLATAD